MRTLAHLFLLIFITTLSACGGSSESEPQSTGQKDIDTTEEISQEISSGSNIKESSDDKEETAPAPVPENGAEDNASNSNDDSKVDSPVHKAGAIVPSYETIRFNASHLSSIEDVYKAAVDLAYLNYYFVDLYDGFYPASNTRIKPFLSPGVTPEIIENSALDKEKIISTYYEIPPEHFQPEGITYHRVESTFNSQLEYFNPVTVNEEMQDTLKRAGWQIYTEYKPVNQYTHPNYSRVYATGDSFDARTLIHQTKVAGIWRERLNTKVLNGKVSFSKVLEEDTEIEVDTKISQIVGTDPDELIYFNGKYKQYSNRDSAAVSGNSILFSTLKTGSKINGELRVYPFELNNFAITLKRLCTAFSECDNKKISLAQGSEGELASKKLGQLFNFKVTNNTEVADKWPILLSGEAVLSDNYGNKATVSYSEAGITIKLNDSENSVLETWDK